MTLRIKRLTATAILPQRADAGSIGFDLCADLGGPAALPLVVIGGGAPVLVSTGIALALPQGAYGRIAPRSGLAAKHGIDVLAGVIDPSYRGGLGVVLVKHGGGRFEIGHGDRIAQLIVEAAMTPQVVEVGELDETARGAGGFGSTGTALVPDEGGNFRLQWSPPAGQAPNDEAVGKVTLKAFGVRRTPDGAVEIRDPDTGEVEVVSWETATEMGLWPTRVWPAERA